MEKKLVFDDIIKDVKKYNPDTDIDFLKNAFIFAKESHQGQIRKSGIDYIFHPLEVAKILASLEVDDTTLVASFLHDTIEDCGVSKETITEKFGENVSHLVEGVTKLGKLNFGSKEEVQAENFRKMFLAMATDIRVIIIKLADRLHNMRTLKYLSEEKQKRISLETKEIYSPLAHRLGMAQIKWEMEDLCFRYLHTTEYNQIKSLVNEKREERELYVNDFIEEIKKQIVINGNFKSEVYGRAKHFKSIYNKLIKQNIDFNELYDLFAIRILVGSLKDCYTALGIVHTLYKPIPGRFKDYIAMPKSNLYQSLHTTIIGAKGRPVEIQIRTTDMHRVAEYGIAAHWTYKEGKAKDQKFEMKLSWLRQLIDWQKDLMDAKDYMHNLKLDLFTDESFVFTPKGDVHALPQNSTPVDFAYLVHTEVGHRCVGAKVNGKIVQLNHTLQNGDIVEVITAKNNSPKLNWLNFVVTHSAKAKIKGWFNKQNADEKSKKIKEGLITELKKQGILYSDKFVKEIIDEALKRNKLKKQEDLFGRIARGDLSIKQIVDFTRRQMAKKAKPEEDEEIEQKFKTKVKGKSQNNLIDIQGESGIAIILSKCCTPIPGDEIIGFVSRGHGISIHRSDCPNILNKKDSIQTIPVNWNQDIKHEYHSVNIRVEGFDRIGAFNDILNQIANLKLNISNASIKTNKKNQLFMATITLDVIKAEDLNHALTMLRQMKDIHKAYRLLN